MDRLHELEVDVVGFNGGETAFDKERFINRRAEIFWNLREAFERGEIDIDADDDQLAAQLGSLKWGVDSRGRIKIESKDDMRKRGMPSPDRADALAYAWSRSGGSASMAIDKHISPSLTGDLLKTNW